MEGVLAVPNLVGALVYSIIGCVVLCGAFKILDFLTPTNLWHEIIEEHNQALSILIGAIAIGMAIIISAAIKG